MSGRAAWRLEALGFSEVYRYRDGKADWMASGLPVEGRRASEPRIGDVAHRGAPTCFVDDSIMTVQQRLEETGFELCIVVNAEQVVLGAISKSSAQDSTAETAVDDVMD